MNRLNIIDEPITLAATTVLGYAAGQTFPSRLAVCTAAFAITLPPIRSTSSTTLPGLVTEGCGAIEMTFYATGANAVTLAAASGDTLLTVPTIATANAKATVKADPATTTWYVIG